MDGVDKEFICVELLIFLVIFIFISKNIYIYLFLVSQTKLITDEYDYNHGMKSCNMWLRSILAFPLVFSCYMNMNYNFFDFGTGK